MYSKLRANFWMTVISLIASLIVVLLAYATVYRVVIVSTSRNALIALKQIDRVYNEKTLQTIPPKMFNRIPATVIILRNDEYKVIQDALGIGEQVEKILVLSAEKKIFDLNGEYFLKTQLKTTRGIIVAIQPANHIVELLKRTAGLFFIVWLIGAGVILFFSFLFSSRFIKSIGSIIKRAEKISREMEELLPEEGLSGEMLELTKSLNKMILRLRNALEDEKAFSVSAAHELKTPLANIIGYVGMLRRWGLQHEDIAYESLERIERTAIELNDLVSKFLNLNEPIDLSKMLEIQASDFLNDYIDELKGRLPNRKIEVDCKADPFLKIPDGLLENILNILVDNANKFSPENLPIRIVVENNKIGVMSYGPKILEEYKEKIFEPFFRLDKEKKGHGLGLTIARRLARKAGWDVYLDISKEGNIFWIKFN